MKAILSLHNFDNLIKYFFPISPCFQDFKTEYVLKKIIFCFFKPHKQNQKLLFLTSPTPHSDRTVFFPDPD